MATRIKGHSWVNKASTTAKSSTTSQWHIGTKVLSVLDRREGGREGVSNGKEMHLSFWDVWKVTGKKKQLKHKHKLWVLPRIYQKSVCVQFYFITKFSKFIRFFTDFSLNSSRIFLPILNMRNSVTCFCTPISLATSGSTRSDRCGAVCLCCQLCWLNPF